MKSFPEYYPPSPRKVPSDLTEPSAPFRRQMNIVIFALLMFFLLYFGLILALTLGVIYCVTTPGPLYAGRLILAVILLLPIVLLVKNLFNKSRRRKGYEVEIFPEDHPRLFRFLECVCEETGAPMPDHVLIDYQVNASAGSDISIASLFSPPKRYLTLGLGLVNILNMTELKTLLAHEFGHFSQQSMPSAPFVRLAMVVVDNIICGTRIAALDSVMRALFYFMVKIQSQLSREMEFHADLVAVSVAGSDAPPQLLFKCTWAEKCLQQTVHDLDTAREHNLFSKDVFLHQREVSRFLRRLHKDPNLGEPPAPFRDRKRTWQLFQADEDEVAAMWSTHPSNYDRELNAKACYIRTDFDNSSPWILFGDRASLCRDVSAQLYREVFGVRPKNITWSAPSRVQNFLNEERDETNFDTEKYGLLYHTRGLQSLDLRQLRTISEENLNSPQDLLASHRAMYSPAVKKFGEIYARHQEECDMLQAITERWYRPKRNRFEMRGQSFRSREAGDLLKDVEKELEADIAWLRAFDIKVFVTYFELALHLDSGVAEELYERYKFHFIIQGMWLLLQQRRSHMDHAFNILTAVRNVAEENNDGNGMVLDDRTFHGIIEIFRKAYEAAKMVLEESEMLNFPNLANMPAGKPVRPFLLKGHLQNKPSHFDDSIDPMWLFGFYASFNDILKRLYRLHFKGLGNILALQEAIGERAETKWG